MQEGSRDSRPPPRVGSQPCAGDSAPVPPAVIHPEQSLPGNCYKGGGASRNNGVGHPKGEPQVWALRGVKGTSIGSQPGGEDGPETAPAAKTRGGMLQKRSGKKEGQRGEGRGRQCCSGARPAQAQVRGTRRVRVLPSKRRGCGRSPRSSVWA